MKNAVYFFLFILLSTSCKESNEPIPAEESDNFTELWPDWTVTRSVNDSVRGANDVYFLTDKIGFVAGQRGLHKTFNSGKTWLKLDTKTPLALTSVFFTNEFVGFVGGSGSAYCPHQDCDKGAILLRTTDGGENWSKIFFQEYVSIGSINFLNESIGLAIGTSYFNIPHLIRTEDGGATWEVITTSTNNSNIHNKLSIQGNTVYMIADNEAVLKSVDFGKTWTTTSLPRSINILGVQFVSPQTGFVFSPNSIHKTSDGGSTWQKFDAPYIGFVPLIHFTNDKEAFGVGIEVGKGLFGYQTSTSGATWQKSSKLYTSFGINHWHFLNSDLGYGVYLNNFYTFERK